MIKTNVKRSYDMKCDICGKTETIYETDYKHIPDWWTRHWSKVEFNDFMDKSQPIRFFDLCPTCTRKFKKLVKNVEIEGSEEE